MLLKSCASYLGQKSPETCHVSGNAVNKERPCKEENCSGIPVIEISSDDDKTVKKVNLEASCSYPGMMPKSIVNHTSTCYGHK